LRQVDLDGRVAITHIEAIDVVFDKASDEVFAMTVYPNPTVSEVNFDINVVEAGNIEIALYARDGKLITRLIDEEITTPGMKTFTFDVSDVPSGTYVVSLQIGEQTIIEKLNILK